MVFYTDVAAKPPGSRKQMLSHSQPHPGGWTVLRKRLWLSPEVFRHWSHLQHKFAVEESSQHHSIEKTHPLPSSPGSLSLLAPACPGHLPVCTVITSFLCQHVDSTRLSKLMARYPSPKEPDVRWEIQSVQLFPNREEICKTNFLLAYCVTMLSIVL